MITYRLSMPKQIDHYFISRSSQTGCQKLFQCCQIAHTFLTQLLLILQQLQTELRNGLKLLYSPLQFYQSTQAMSNIVKNQGSPLKREGSIVSLAASSLVLTETRLKNNHQIQSLLNKVPSQQISKFYEVSGQVDVSNDQHFNLINYERENDKIKYDPQMMMAKLRKLQNRAQINRAQREIQNRDKKKMKRLSLHRQKEDVKTYKTIYQDFLKNNKLTDQFEDLSDQESNENKTKPQGISYFSQLKRHPMLLQYTLKKINKKQLEHEEKLKNLENTMTKMKKQNSEIPAEYRDLYEDFNKKLLFQNQTNPESIIQNRFSKFYTKKSSDKLSKEVINNPRCSRMIQKQNEIVSEIQQRSLSKQNKLKLKSKLNQIITGISKSQKLSNFTLPKLQSSQSRDIDRKQL